MKFLVLALCVCAASAASFGSNPFSSGGYKPYRAAAVAANNVVAPAAVAAKTVVAPAAVAAKTVAETAAAGVVAPVAVAAAATYNAGSSAYQTAKQVVNKGYTAEGNAAILRSDSESGADNFRFAFETDNGIISEANGAYKLVGDSGAVVSQGSYRYIAPDGTPVEVVYTADENGYHPQSASLPVAPEIPPAIARALEYIAAKSRETVQKY